MNHLKHLFTTMLFMCCSIATAHDFVVDGIYYSITDATNNTVEVTYRGDSYSSYYNEYTGSVAIPENITFFGTTYSVTRIGSSAFNGCTGLTSIKIPNSVTSIGSSAFRGCSGLTNVIIPNSVKSIGDLAFSGCTGLVNMTIGNSVTSIGSRAFEGCNNLLTIYNLSQISFTIGSTKIINIPNGDILDDYIFLTNNGIHTLYKYVGIETNLILPDSYNGNSFAIGDSVFYDYSELTSITIPNSVISIGDYAFYGCTGLKKIDFNCKNIGSWFKNNTSIEEVIIGNGVTSIGADAFNGCTGLTSVTIPNSVTSIGRSAFNGCTGLTSIKIPNSVTSIGSSAFRGCSGLTSITIPNSVTSIGDYAFSSCTGLTSVTIPNSVTSIGDYAFYGCNRIEELYISRSIKSIGSYAFAECNNIFIIRIGAEHLITTYENVFSEDAYINAILYVPIGTKTFYESISPWSNFYILEMDFTDIKDVKCENGIVKGVYDLHGRKIEKPINGIYIINGKKVFIK